MSVAAGQAYGTKWRKVGRECELMGQAARRCLHIRRCFASDKAHISAVISV